MELETAKNVIKRYITGHQHLCMRADVANRYYANKTDISFMPKKTSNDVEPLHQADNRVCSSFYSLLVNQKAGYVFSVPPVFDVGSEKGNRLVRDVLGDKWAKNCKSLCIKASNEGVAWVHYYIYKDEFRYSVLDGRSVIPIYSENMERELVGALRVFSRIDEVSGKEYEVYQLWNSEECAAYERDITNSVDIGLQPYNMFGIENVLISGYDTTNVYKHGFGRVPFIPFCNNDLSSSDLDNIKGLIDTYDKTYSGFANDLEDIQEVIMILTGYEGENLNEFLTQLKKYKTVKLDGVDGGSLSTLTIDIPVEARKELLAMTRRAIFEQGQGIDPDPQNFGNASGVALQHLYSLLELKAGLMETEFRLSFAELVRAICENHGIQVSDIEQTWTRTKIRNESELADIATKSKGIISDDTIIKHHPFVTDFEKEKQAIDEQESKVAASYVMPERDSNE